MQITNKKTIGLPCKNEYAFWDKIIAFFIQSTKVKCSPNYRLTMLLLTALGRMMHCHFTFSNCLRQETCVILWKSLVRAQRRQELNELLCQKPEGGVSRAEDKQEAALDLPALCRIPLKFKAE